MQIPCCIYNLYLYPLNGRLPEIEHPRDYPKVPCLFEKPPRPHLLMVDASEDYSFDLEVTDRFMRQTLERGSQSLDCENSNYRSQSSVQDQENKGRPDALNASRHMVLLGKEYKSVPQTKPLRRGCQNSNNISKSRKAGEHWELLKTQATKWPPRALVSILSKDYKE